MTRTPRRHTPRILVLGYGSTLRSDDAVGGLAAAEVGRWGLPGVRALVRHQLTPELSQEAAAADLVVFIDANADLAEAQVQVQAIGPAEQASHDPHAMGPRAVLGLAASLFGARPRAYLVTVPTATFELGETLSDEARAGLTDALAAVRRLLEAGGD